VRRRKKPELHDNHDRWLISYADFITLLFAFFVVLFAASQVDQNAMFRLAAAYSAYLSGDSLVVTLPESPAAEEPADEEDLRMRWVRAELGEVRQEVEGRLARLISEGKVAVELQPRGLVLSLREAAFFDPGKASFRTGAIELLDEVGAAVKEARGQPIRLEGHTDNVPIRTERFPSNWELSAARAIEVMELLRGRYGINVRRLSVAGYGEYRPIAGNNTPQSRAVNRRVDIVILSRAAAAMAPRQKLPRGAGGAARKAELPPAQETASPRR